MKTLIRKEMSEVTDEIAALLKGETAEIKHLSSKLAYKIQEIFNLDNSEVILSDLDAVESSYTLVLIDGVI